MAKKKSSRAKYSTSISEAAAKEKIPAGIRIGPGLIFRAALGTALAVGCIWAFLHSWALAGAAIQGKQGWERARNQPGAHLAGVADIRRALRVDPHNPNYNLWLANLLFQRESDRSRRLSLAHIEADRFHEALQHLRRAEQTSRNPTSTVMLMGDAAAMLSTYYREAGEQEQELRYSQVAAENYLLYRQYAIKPASGRARGYYERSISRALHTGWPFTVLTLFDDWRYYFPDQAREETAILDMADVAYRQMGEFPIMMTHLSIRAMDTPHDIPLLGRIQRAADENHQVLHALKIFESLHRQGRLPEQAVPVIDQFKAQLAMRNQMGAQQSEGGMPPNLP
ncbi:MAG: hypothetical protein JJU11_02440 [Candidatus Sumerlaeia bacterium]|nr:hypothetical protein [Candidatus Sumerlaeia bacterium]